MHHLTHIDTRMDCLIYDIGLSYIRNHMILLDIGQSS